jgi:hypothetical protein
MKMRRIKKDGGNRLQVSFLVNSPKSCGGRDVTDSDRPPDLAAAGSSPRFMLLVHHTDAVREYAYDRNSSVGRLDKALDEANAKGWTVVSMKDDWKKIFAFQ